jgi:hypothetical protein
MAGRKRLEIVMNKDANGNPINDFVGAEEPTQPIPHETLSEVSARWRAEVAAREIATSERPTVNIRPPTKR